MKLCMNPGIVHDWSIIDEHDITLASSNFGTFETERQTEDSFEAIVEMAKADAIPFEYEEWSETEYGYDWGGDLYFIKSYDSVDELRADFDKVITFLKEQ